MPTEDLIRLRHMLDAAEEALSFAHKQTRTDLDGNRMLVLSLVKAVEIVGEAAYQVSEATQLLLPQIPWDDMIGMRHRLVHAYFAINLDILWQTVQDDLPALIAILQSILADDAS